MFEAVLPLLWLLFFGAAIDFGWRRACL